MVMDNTNLYIGSQAKDDHIGADLSLSQGEASEFYWSFYNADTVTVWPDSLGISDHNFGCRWAGTGDGRWDQYNGTITGWEIAASVDSNEAGAGTASWEIKIPLANIGSGFTPVDGMRMPFNLLVNTVDSTRTDRGEVLTVGCVESSPGDDTLLLPTNPYYWDRPNTWGQIIISSVNLVSVDKDDQIPDKFNLSQNYPNPFNPTTSIRYSVAQSGLVKLVVYDILGRQVKTLVNEIKNAGTYDVPFDASALTSGVYFYRIAIGNFIQTKRMVLVK
jgi:hypothetical protein